MKKFVAAILLVGLAGCHNFHATIKTAKTNLVAINNHANAAHTILQRHREPDIVQADKEVEQIPPLVTLVEKGISTLEGDYDRIYNSWYARLGRFVDRVFWTLVISFIAAIVVSAIANFYTGGLVFGAIGSAFASLGKMIGGLFQLPIKWLHNFVVAVINRFKPKATVASGA